MAMIKSTFIKTILKGDTERNIITRSLLQGISISIDEIGGTPTAQPILRDNHNGKSERLSYNYTV